MKKLILLSLVASGLFVLPAVGAVERQEINYEDFFEAVRLGDVKQVEEMIQAGAEVDHQDERGLTALIWAAYKGHVAVVDLLLKKGAHIDHQDEGGWTALMVASREGYLGIVDLLIKKGAAIDLKDNGERTALMWAACKGHVTVVDLLLSGTANHQSEDRSRALISAALRGRVEVIDLLLKSGAAIDHPGESGLTALMWAAKRGDIEVMKTLLLAGANPHIKNEKNKNQTALDVAKEAGKEKEYREAVRLAQLTRQAMRLLWKGFEDEENSPLSKLPAELIVQIIGYL